MCYMLENTGPDGPYLSCIPENNGPNSPYNILSPDGPQIQMSRVGGLGGDSPTGKKSKKVYSSEAEQDRM